MKRALLVFLWNKLCLLSWVNCFQFDNKSSGSVVNKANSLTLYHEVETCLYTNITHKLFNEVVFLLFHQQVKQFFCRNFLKEPDLDLKAFFWNCVTNCFLKVSLLSMEHNFDMVSIVFFILEILLFVSKTN